MASAIAPEAGDGGAAGREGRRAGLPGGLGLALAVVPGRLGEWWAGSSTRGNFLDGSEADRAVLKTGSEVDGEVEFGVPSEGSRGGAGAARLTWGVDISVRGIEPRRMRLATYPIFKDRRNWIRPGKAEDWIRKPPKKKAINPCGLWLSEYAQEGSNL